MGKTVTRFREVEARIFDSYGLPVAERFVNVPSLGVRLRVQEVGSGAPLVYLNGIGATATGFASLVGQLRGFRHVLVDLPGHGLSDRYDWSSGPVRRQAVSALEEVLDHLGLRAPVLVGNSLGGMFALWLAVDRPQRVRAGVIAGDPAIALPGAHGDALLAALGTPGLGWVVERALQLPVPREQIRKGFRHMLGEPAANKASADMLDLYALTLRLPGQAHSFRALARRLLHGRQPRPEHQLSDVELHTLKVPLLFIWGTRDIFCTPAVGQTSVAKIPQAELVQIDAGHCPWFDDPVECAHHVRQFVAALRPGEDASR